METKSQGLRVKVLMEQKQAHQLEIDIEATNQTLIYQLMELRLARMAAAKPMEKRRKRWGIF